MKLTPLADRVILKMVEVEETTKGGIIPPPPPPGPRRPRRLGQSIFATRMSRQK